MHNALLKVTASMALNEWNIRFTPITLLTWYSTNGKVSFFMVYHRSDIISTQVTVPSSKDTHGKCAVHSTIGVEHRMHNIASNTARTLGNNQILHAKFSFI